MTGLPIWGNLNRATNDATLIDEAIAEVVVAHNDDPDAHLGADQSLQSHRAAEIIDHLAESVVNDKISPQARRFVAIVDPESEYDFATIEGAVEYAIGKNGGDIFIKRGTHTLSYDLNIPMGVSLFGEGIDETIISTNAARLITIGSSTTAANNVEAYECARQNDEDGAVDMDSTNFPDPISVGDEFLDTSDGQTYTVADVIDEYSLVFSPIPSYAYNELFEVQRYYPSDVEIDRTIVTLNDIFTSDYAGLTPGMSLTDIEDNVIGKIDSLPGSMQIKLTTAVAGSATTIRVVVQYLGTMKQEIESLTFDCSSYIVTLWQNAYAGDAELGLDFARCAFRGGKVKFAYYNDNNLYNTFTDCIVEFDNSTTYKQISNTQFNRCIFIATVGSATIGTLVGKIVMRDCTFDRNGKTSVVYFSSSYERMHMENCLIDSDYQLTIGNNSADSTTIVGCRLYFSGSQSLYLRGANILVNMNKINFGSTGNMSTPSTSGRTIVTSNILNKAPSITTTIKVVANNIES